MINIRWCVAKSPAEFIFTINYLQIVSPTSNSKLALTNAFTVISLTLIVHQTDFSVWSSVPFCTLAMHSSYMAQINRT
ncbi:hypothetical protein BOX15_Mlig032085g1 [Macrostomum lignano]|uniref:Uncharacterized protein n=1 Tax=Macrostomum lignano TaxID=282301 RepID=A0A267E0L4_9PLAT|nr:hypothetical protein BOX15_Mlig032085g1 [Macrostomum lignano]